MDSPVAGNGGVGSRNGVAEFLCSFEKLRVFWNNWFEVFDKRCADTTDNQLKASYYLWARYSISIHTISQLCQPCFLPDLYVIARCCIEFSVSLRAVLTEKDLATDYLQFEKHAKSNYYKKFGDTMDPVKIQQMQNHLKSLCVENTDDYKRDKWCKRAGGITKLIRKHAPDIEIPYWQFSHFAHGSVLALQILQRMAPDHRVLLGLVDFIYADYIRSTKVFVAQFWGQVATSESERCKGELSEVALAFNPPKGEVI